MTDCLKLCALTLALAGLSLLAACGTPSLPATPAAEPAAVTLLVFSGRPDPVWQLSTVQATALAELLGSLAPAGPVNLPEPLGYRGFHFSWPGDPPGSWVTGRAYRGIVEIADGEVRYLDDPGRLVERWLLDTARPHIEGQLYNQILVEIGR